MIIDIIEYQLKDGRTARIRSPKDEDIQEMLDFLYVSAGETDFLMRCPEDAADIQQKVKNSVLTE